MVNELADVHCPVVEMSTRSKLSCLSWNKYIKAHIASSDYEGIITVWDVNTRQVCRLGLPMRKHLQVVVKVVYQVIYGRLICKVFI